MMIEELSFAYFYSKIYGIHWCHMKESYLQ